MSGSWGRIEYTDITQVREPLVVVRGVDSTSPAVRGAAVRGAAVRGAAVRGAAVRGARNPWRTPLGADPLSSQRKAAGRDTGN